MIVWWSLVFCVASLVELLARLTREHAAEAIAAHVWPDPGDEEEDWE